MRGATPGCVLCVRRPRKLIWWHNLWGTAGGREGGRVGDITRTVAFASQEQEITRGNARARRA